MWARGSSLAWLCAFYFPTRRPSDGSVLPSRGVIGSLRMAGIAFVFSSIFWCTSSAALHFHAFTRGLDSPQDKMKPNITAFTFQSMALELCRLVIVEQAKTATIAMRVSSSLISGDAQAKGSQ
ncbi:hypothetical protein J3A83DRAFT_4225749 [Scleroderma citrinum]